MVKGKIRNPTGKGGFQERPQDINRTGLNRRDRQNWQATIKRITDMTRDEAVEYVGKKSKVARLLRELPADLPIKDALVFISIIQYGRDPNPRMLSTLMDRENGKPREDSGGSELTNKNIVIPADLIAPDFLNVYRDIKDRKHTEYLFHGGRGSTKSSPL